MTINLLSFYFELPALILSHPVYQLLIAAALIFSLFQVYKKKYYVDFEFNTKEKQFIWSLFYLSVLALIFLPEYLYIFNVGFYYLLVTQIFFYYGREKEVEELSYSKKISHRLHEIYYHPRYINISAFWAEDYNKRDKAKVFFLDFPVLLLLSFLTAITSRFSLVQNAFFLRAFLFGYFYYVALYLGVIFFTTLLVILPPVNAHLKQVYGNEALKKLGWNGLWETINNSLVPALKIGATVLFAGSAAIAAEQEITDAWKFRTNSKLFF